MCGVKATVRHSNKNRCVGRYLPTYGLISTGLRFEWRLTVLYKTINSALRDYCSIFEA